LRPLNAAKMCQRWQERHSGKAPDGVRVSSPYGLFANMVRGSSRKASMRSIWLVRIVHVRALSCRGAFRTPIASRLMALPVCPEPRAAIAAPCEELSYSTG
jgi:hypothetical protein